MKKLNTTFLKPAFTLAEVLVTLAIVGVVSAMTVPTLVQNYQRDSYVTQLKKVYTELSQAAIKAAQDNNAVSLDESMFNKNHANGAKNFITNYFKVAKDCGTSLTPCFADSYKTMAGANFTLRNNPVYVASITNGAAISVVSNDFAYVRNGHGNLGLQVDINGSAGPNIAGRDLFYMRLFSDGTIGDAHNNPTANAASCGVAYNARDAYSDNYYSGFAGGCLSKIIRDGWRMTY